MLLSALTLVLAAIAPVLCYHLLCYLLRIRPLPGIPVLPGAIPFFGHSYGMIRHVIKTSDLGGWFDETVESGGAPTISQIMKTWREPDILVSDPSEIDRINASPDFDNSNTFAEVFAGLIPLAMLGRLTDNLVKVHRRAFAYSHSLLFMNVAGRYLSTHLDVVLERWGAAAEHGTFFAADEDLRLLMTDVIAQLAFGESFHQVETGKIHPVASALTTLSNSISGGAFIALQHWIQRRRPSYQHALRTYNQYFASRVEHARDRIRDGGEIAEIQCLIDVVMRKEARDGEGNVMPEDELRDEMFLSMFAGQETTTSMQLWLLKYLPDHPHVQHKLRDSLVATLPLPTERAPTVAEVSPEVNPYLEAVIHEALRLGGAVGGSERQAIRPTTLYSSTTGAAYPIPKGAVVTLQAAYTARHRMKSGDGDEFKPERWLDPATGVFDQTRVWSRPFGGGPRMCYGYRLALVFLRLFLAQLSLRYFLLPLSDEMRTEEVTHLVTRRPKRNFVGVKRWGEVRADVAVGKEKVGV